MIFMTNTPLPRGKRVTFSDQRFLVKYTTAPTSNALSGLVEQHDIIPALNELDARVSISKKTRKAGRYIHAFLDISRL